MEQDINSKTAMAPYSREELEEDILETLCLWKQQNITATELRLCSHFNIARATLTASLKKLLDRGCIRPYQKNSTIELTKLGFSQGNENLYRHNSISQFLQFVGVKEEIAEQDACRAEHIFSSESVEALCSFVSTGYTHYTRKLRNTDLRDRYQPGTYQFDMQIYSMEQCRPRRFREEYGLYTGNIYLEVGRESWFELEYCDSAADERFRRKLWYKKSVSAVGDEWIEASRGERGERIPANAFEFVIMNNEALVEGHLLIALTGDNEVPEIWNSSQLELEIW